MARDSGKLDVCACRCRCNLTLAKISSVFVIFFAFAYAQIEITAQLEESNTKAKIREIIGPEYQSRIRDPEHFWEQSRQHTEKQNAEYNYDYSSQPSYDRDEIQPDDKNNYYDYYYPREEQGEDTQDHPHVSAQYEAATNDTSPEYYYPREEQGEDTQEHPHVLAQYEAVTDDKSKDREEKPCTGENGCPKRGVSLAESEAMMIETVKRQLLHALRMKEPPNGTHPDLSYDSPVIRRLLKKYDMKVDRNLAELEDEYDDDPDYELDETTKETVISYARDPLHPGQTGSYFKFNEDDFKYTVESALIWFYVKGNISRTNITIDLYRYQRNATHPDAPPVEVKFDRKVIRTHAHGHWKQLSVKNIVSKWFINPETNLGMDIRCREIPGLVFSGPVQRHENKKPLLEISLSHNAQSRRKKRNAMDFTCTQQSNIPTCCRYKISISFENMGWSWIISPKRYTTYYCAGDCPANYLESNQNRMFELAASQLKPEGMRACCTPTLMTDMSMLYWDNQDNIVFSSVPNMRVKKCGCM